MKRLHIYIIGVLLGCFTAAAQAPDATAVIDSVRRQVAPDRRQVVLEAEMSQLPSGGLVLRGNTSESAAHDALVAALADADFEFVDSLTVYPSDKWGLVSIPVASLRTRGAHAGEMATQAVLGTPIRILDDNDDWYRVQTPDGYIAYVPDSSVATKTVAEMAQWRGDDSRRIVSSLWQTQVFTAADAVGPRDVVTDLVLGSIVQVESAQPQSGRIMIVLPDGRRGWVAESALTTIGDWADQQFDAKKILDTAYSMEGTPYLWGGMSTKATDCSGLVKISYYNNGLILRRDASQQALTGQILEGGDDAWHTYQAGDLLFFGNSAGRITHVGIYDSDSHFVHASGRVKRNSLDTSAPDYLYSPDTVSRIHGCEGSDGIVRAIDHPWYFNISK